jgi:hypothetical protein
LSDTRRDSLPDIAVDSPAQWSCGLPLLNDSFGEVISIY